jgi:hypothetical protein
LTDRASSSTNTSLGVCFERSIFDAMLRKRVAFRRSAFDAKRRRVSVNEDEDDEDETPACDGA